MYNAYKSIAGSIELKIIGYDEPNYGRELHIAELYINNINVTENFFKDNWNRLNYNLENFCFESLNNKYVFIPAESNSFIIDTALMKTYFLPYKSISTVKFQKNEFINNKLIVYYTDEKFEIELDKIIFE